MQKNTSTIQKGPMWFFLVLGFTLEEKLHGKSVLSISVEFWFLWSQHNIFLYEPKSLALMLEALKSPFPMCTLEIPQKLQYKFFCS